MRQVDQHITECCWTADILLFHPFKSFIILLDPVGIICQYRWFHGKIDANGRTVTDQAVGIGCEVIKGNGLGQDLKRTLL